MKPILLLCLLLLCFLLPVCAGHCAPALPNALPSLKSRADFAGQGLFVRSSTNAEDLPDFVGAGLYTTVPNVRGEAVLTTAKFTWLC